VTVAIVNSNKLDKRRNSDSNITKLNEVIESLRSSAYYGAAPPPPRPFHNIYPDGVTREPSETHICENLPAIPRTPVDYPQQISLATPVSSESPAFPTVTRLWPIETAEINATLWPESFMSPHLRRQKSQQAMPLTVPRHRDHNQAPAFHLAPQHQSIATLSRNPTQIIATSPFLRPVSSPFTSRPNRVISPGAITRVPSNAATDGGSSTSTLEYFTPEYQSKVEQQQPSASTGGREQDENNATVTNPDAVLQQILRPITGELIKVIYPLMLSKSLQIHVAELCLQLTGDEGTSLI
jgi:hypothetical protein